MAFLQVPCRELKGAAHSFCVSTSLSHLVAEETGAFLAAGPMSEGCSGWQTGGLADVGARVAAPRAEVKP